MTNLKSPENIKYSQEKNTEFLKTAENESQVIPDSNNRIDPQTPEHLSDHVHQNALPQPVSSIDYLFWIGLERLSAEEICLLAQGLTPTKINDMKQKLKIFFYNRPFTMSLQSGLKTGEIKIYDGYLSPLECFLFLKKKGLRLPVNLINLLENDLEEIQNFLNIKIQIKRSKESYLRKDTRGDERVLHAVLQTLLDLFPSLPKEELIHLKPVQEYANGKQHSDQSLKKIITDIEGQNRKSGNVHKHRTAEIKQCIPPGWMPHEMASEGT